VHRVVGDPAVPVQDMLYDHGRYMRTFVGVADVPNDALDDTTILEAPQLRLVTPQIAEALGSFAVLIRSCRAMIDQAEGVICVQHEPEVDNGWVGRVCLRGRSRRGGRVEGSNGLDAVTKTLLEQ